MSHNHDNGMQAICDVFLSNCVPKALKHRNDLQDHSKSLGMVLFNQAKKKCDDACGCFDTTHEHERRTHRHQTMASTALMHRSLGKNPQNIFALLTEHAQYMS